MCNRTKMVICIFFLLIFASNARPFDPPLPDPRGNPYSLNTLTNPISTPFWIGRGAECDSCPRVNYYPGTENSNIQNTPSLGSFGLIAQQEFSQEIRDKIERLLNLIEKIRSPYTTDDEKMELAKEARQLWREIDKLSIEDKSYKEFRSEVDKALAYYFLSIDKGEIASYLNYIFEP